jgi:hypothetical protein
MWQSVLNVTLTELTRKLAEEANVAVVAIDALVLKLLIGK